MNGGEIEGAIRPSGMMGYRVSDCREAIVIEDNTLDVTKLTF